MEILLEPLEYEFFRHSLLAALMIGALCGLIGVYVILRGMSYVGHGLSHAAFGGAVAGFFLNLNFYAGAGVMGLVAALLIDRITRSGKVKLSGSNVVSQSIPASATRVAAKAHQASVEGCAPNRHATAANSTAVAISNEG